MSASDSRKWWALFAVALSTLVIGLDGTVLTLALPTLSDDLHASTGDLQWFSDAYLLVLAAALLPAGQLGDRFGRKKVMIISLVLFGASSLACAYSTTVAQLIISRAVLGLGAAALIPLSLSILPVLFSAAERPKAIAVMMIATFVAYPAGPLLGGLLLDNFWWGSVFLINVPVVVFAVFAVGFLLPESKGAERKPVDLVGMVVSGLGLAVLTYGLIKAGEDTWGDAVALLAVAVGVVVLLGFVGWERLLGRRPGAQPVIDLSLFRSGGFTWGSVLVGLIAFVMFGILFAMPQYFQSVRGISAFDSGLQLLPLIIALVIAMYYGGKLQTPRRNADGTVTPPRVAPWILATTGFGVMAVGFLVSTFTAADSSLVFVGVWFAIVGLGLGLVMPTAMNAALSALSIERSGAGSAMMSALRQVGATIGVAVLGTVIAYGYRGRVDVTGLPSGTADTARDSVAGGLGVARETGSATLLDSVHTSFVHGLTNMLVTCTVIAALSTAVAFFFLPRPRPAAVSPSAAGARAPEPGERTREKAEKRTV